jgi:hypothetical protein
MLPNDLLKIDNDRLGEPAEDDGVHPDPRRVVSEGVLCQGHQHQVMPYGIVGGRSVQHDVHQLENVWYRRCLNVDVGDECRVVGSTIDHVGRSRG